MKMILPTRDGGGTEESAEYGHVVRGDEEREADDERDEHPESESSSCIASGEGVEKGMSSLAQLARAHQLTPPGRTQDRQKRGRRRREKEILLCRGPQRGHSYKELARCEEHEQRDLDVLKCFTGAATHNLISGLLMPAGPLSRECGEQCHSPDESAKAAGSVFLIHPLTGVH
jgi:hypothetical protein